MRIVLSKSLDTEQVYAHSARIVTVICTIGFEGKKRIHYKIGRNLGIHVHLLIRQYKLKRQGGLKQMFAFLQRQE